MNRTKSGIRKKKYRRSDTKIMTTEAKVLKFLRESRKLSMRKASRVVGLSYTYVSHCEHGRIDLNTALIAKFLFAYKYDFDYFHKLVMGQIEMPQDLFEECLVHLKRLNQDKLKMVKTILQGL